MATSTRDVVRPATAPTASAWAPLRHHVFRMLWIATVASNIGTWMHDTAEGWLMTSLSASPAMVALVSTATSLPIFFLALPAGALADVLDRRRMLLVTQTWMVIAAAILGVLTLLHLVTPWVLLTLTFVMGVGAALNLPPWQAVVSELVPKQDLPEAVALGSIGFNVARAVGPALGGLLVAALGPGLVFLLNAASFFGVILILRSWHRTPPETIAPAERIIGSIKAGVRYVRYSPPLRAVLVRTGAFTFCASALWALLPYLGRRELHLPASRYGLLPSAMGLGAVVAGVYLPRARRAMSVNGMVAAATIVFAAAFVAIASVRTFALVLPALAIAGVAWMAMMSSLNVSAQTASPGWVRARALAIYVLVFQGGFALGSILWGTIAERWGLPWAFRIAAAGLVVGLGAIARFRLAAGDIDLTPSAHWASPTVAMEPHPADGPVMVTVEYVIAPDDAGAFGSAMRVLRDQRLRDGAIEWTLFHDTADPMRFVETFLVESWAEHLRQHERATVADQAVEMRAESFHRGTSPPAVSHLIAERIPRDGACHQEDTR